MVDLSGRNAVVTGAGSGIGRAIALRLSQRGAKLALLGRTLEKLEAVAGEAQGEAICASVDVAVRSQVEEAFRAAARGLGPLHILVANAGIGGPNDLGHGDRWDEIVRTNLDGAYFCIRAFERSIAQGADPRHILVISSCVARFGVPGLKAAMEMVGMYGGPPRSPLLPLTDAQKETLRSILVEAGILGAGIGDQGHRTQGVPGTRVGR